MGFFGTTNHFRRVTNTNQDDTTTRGIEFLARDSVNDFEAKYWRSLFHQTLTTRNSWTRVSKYVDGTVETHSNGQAPSLSTLQKKLRSTKITNDSLYKMRLWYGGKIQSESVGKISELRCAAGSGTQCWFGSSSMCMTFSNGHKAQISYGRKANVQAGCWGENSYGGTSIDSYWVRGVSSSDARYAEYTFFGSTNHFRRVSNSNQQDSTPRGIEILVNNGVARNEH